MYWSKSFIPTSKENPSGAKIPSHQLLIRAGMIKQESAGIYSWLPLGFKVLKKIESIVREEEEAAGAEAWGDSKESVSVSVCVCVCGICVLCL